MPSQSVRNGGDEVKVRRLFRGLALISLLCNILAPIILGYIMLQDQEFTFYLFVSIFVAGPWLQRLLLIIETVVFVAPIGFSGILFPLIWDNHNYPSKKIRVISITFFSVQQLIFPLITLGYYLPNGFRISTPLMLWSGPFPLFVLICLNLYYWTHPVPIKKKSLAATHIDPQSSDLNEIETSGDWDESKIRRL